MQQSYLTITIGKTNYRVVDCTDLLGFIPSSIKVCTGMGLGLTDRWTGRQIDR